jgi:hypothetical protein
MIKGETMYSYGETMYFLWGDNVFLWERQLITLIIKTLTNNEETFKTK